MSAVNARQHMVKLPRWATSLAGFLAWAFLLAVIYAQFPLFTSNQNQYFLHGLAAAGYGNLRQDWLAQTADPTPLFSRLVQFSYLVFQSKTVFYFYYALIMGVYLYSLFDISDYLFDISRSRNAQLTFITLVLALHSVALKMILASALGADWKYIFEGGVAGQRLLGEVFEPSTFGVFLVLSIDCFMRGRYLQALLALALSIWVHPTYLLAGGILTLAFLWVLFGEKKRVKKTVVFGLGALSLVAPVLYSVYTSFGTGDLLLVEKARRILVEIRIPHHAIVQQWFNSTVILQIGLVAIALALVRRTKVFPILLIPSLVGGILTAVQIVLSGTAAGNMLALLFPWRISVVLVPLASTMILAALVSKLLPEKARHLTGNERAMMVLCFAIIALLALFGALRFQIEVGRKNASPEHAMMEFVRQSGTAGEVFLVPLDMQDFRLESGEPVFVDFKSIPYRYDEVLEWRRRENLAGKIYRQPEQLCQNLPLLNGEGITHIVLESSQSTSSCLGLVAIYRDQFYTVYQINPADLGN